MKHKTSSSDEAMDHAKYAIVILSPGFFKDARAMSVLDRLISRQLNGERLVALGVRVLIKVKFSS